MSRPSPQHPKPIRLTSPNTVALVALIAAAMPVACPSSASAQHAHSVSRSTEPAGPATAAPREGAGEAERVFMAAMLEHHREGLELIELAATKADRTDLRTLVMRIRSNYQDEAAMMRAWLRERQESIGRGFEPLPLRAWGHGIVIDRHRMLTPRQMEDLREATGPEFDVLFLAASIQHHTAALQLVDSLLASPAGAQDEAVFRIIESLEGEQSSYVGHMRRMLREALLLSEQD